MALARSSGRSQRRRAATAARRQNTPRWAWWVPAVVSIVLLFFPFYVVRLIALVVGIIGIVYVGRHPLGAVKWLIVLMPFHQALFAGLYQLGLPADIVRSLALWKEGLIAGLLVAAARKAMREAHRIDRLDGLALAYVGLGVAYLMLPGLFLGDATGASLDFSTRLLGFRTDVLYVALFLAARHLRFDASARRTLTRAFLVTATIVCVIAYFEYTFQDLWNTIWLDWLGLAYYKVDVLQITGDPNIGVVQTRTIVAGRDLLRAGSVFLLPFALGCYGAVAVAVLGDRIVRGVARRVDYVALVVVCGAVLLTITRTAIFALGVVLVASLFRRSERSASEGRARSARVRFTLILAAILVVAVPVAAALGVVDRFGGKDDYSSNDAHRDSFGSGYDILLSEPLGRGLATSAGAGQRADVAEATITETQFLQIGTQLGILGLALWLLVAFHVLLALGTADRRAPPRADRDLLAGSRTALLGLVAAGLFLQIFIEFSLSWTTWILAGLALGSIEAARHDAAPAQRASYR